MLALAIPESGDGKLSVVGEVIVEIDEDEGIGVNIRGVLALSNAEPGRSAAPSTLETTNTQYNAFMKVPPFMGSS